MRNSEEENLRARHALSFISLTRLRFDPNADTRGACGIKRWRGGWMRKRCIKSRGRGGGGGGGLGWGERSEAALHIQRLFATTWLINSVARYSRICLCRPPLIVAAFLYLPFLVFRISFSLALPLPPPFL
jgi:hypothetical protein